ncbi:LOW QUALITY PROTEIN: uncharacterized protein C1orf167 homolog [Mirounga angustirostris]|uniref:LOW QUALITY PROTEIN: uncharacterized protein C1orf167 homolog n=1 Tax=Mirounga angustirostris TaxID=9716 RepID=UPI00313EF1CB
MQATPKVVEKQEEEEGEGKAEENPSDQTGQTAGCGVGQGHCRLGFALEPMELRPDANHKENVPPRPAAPLRPEQQRFLKSRDVGLGSGLGRWVRSYQAQRGGPAATPSPGAKLHQETCRVQTNLAGPSPGLSLVLKDTTGRLMNSSLQQQSNLERPAGRPQGRARELAIQQNNLSMRGTSSAECRSPISPHLWPHTTPLSPHDPRPQGSLVCPSSRLRQSRLLATGSPSPDVQPAAGFAPFNGHTRPGSRLWCGLGSWPSRLRGEPLTLEDLTVPVQSQARGPSQTAIHQLLASVRHLEHAVARLGCQASQESSSGQVLPAHAQPSQPVLASWDGRKKHLPGLRETADFPETQGTQAGLSDSQANRKPASLETTLGILTGDFLDPKQGVLLAKPLRQGENFSPGPTYGSGQRGGPWLPRGVGSKEARLCSPAHSCVAQGVPAGQKWGQVILLEQVTWVVPGPQLLPGAQGPGPPPDQPRSGPSWQWLSRCFGAWWHLVQGRRTAAAAEALGHPQVLRRGLGALGRAPRLQEAQLEVAWRRHTQALLAQSFQKWRNQTLQQKQGQPHVQAGPGPPPSGAGQGQDWKKITLATELSVPGGAPSGCGRLWRPSGHPAVRAWWPEQGQRVKWLVQGSAVARTTHTSAFSRFPRCFGAWQQFVQRATRSRDHLARRRAGSLKLYLQQWVRMKQLRASDGAKVIRLSLCRQKAGNVSLCSSAPRAATARGLGVVAQAQGLPQEQGGGSLQEACRRLALHRALLLWRTRLSQRQRADSFLRGMRQQMIRRILKGWHLKAGGPSTPSDSARTTLAPELLSGIPGREPLLGCSPPRSSLEKVRAGGGGQVGGKGGDRAGAQGSRTPSLLPQASRAPALLETLRLSFLWASGQRQKARCLLLWQVQAQQSRGAAKWHQRTLQRRILLGWSHWATARGARRELAAGWAWERSCRAALGLWRRRLVQGREVEQWVRARGRTLVRRALNCWHSSWQRQQFLHAKYQRWVQVHLRGLRRSVFQNWRQAAARRRHPVDPPEQLLLHSHFQAWYGAERDTGVVPATGASQDGPRKAVGATIAMWQDARVAKAWAQEQFVARASVARWRSHVQGGRADRQLSRARARQAFVAWQAALGQRHKARRLAEGRVALCRTQRVRESRLRRVSRARAAQKLSASVLEAWAQSAARGHVQRATITQFQQAGSRRLLWTHWAQWQAALLSMWLEPQAEAQEARAVDLRQWPRVANRRRLLALTNTPAPWKQTAGVRVAAPAPVSGVGGPGGRARAGLSRGGGPSLRPVLLPGGSTGVRGSALLPGHEGVLMLLAIRVHARASPHQEEVPAALAPPLEMTSLKASGSLYGSSLKAWGQVQGSALAHLKGHPAPRRPVTAPSSWCCRAVGGRHSRGAGGQQRPGRGLSLATPTAEAVAPEVGLACVAAAGPAAMGGSAITAPFLPPPRFQALEKWRQHLAARGWKRGATSGLIPEPGGHQEPGSRLEAARARVWGLEAEQGTQLQL